MKDPVHHLSLVETVMIHADHIVLYRIMNYFPFWSRSAYHAARARSGAAEHACATILLKALRFMTLHFHNWQDEGSSLCTGGYCDYRDRNHFATARLH